jgi:hypothetical protein
MMKMAQQQQARKVMRTSRESAPEMKNPLSENTRFAGSMHPTAAASYGARPAVVSRSNCMRHVAIAYMIYYRQKQQHAAAIVIWVIKLFSYGSRRLDRKSRWN